MDIIEPFLNFFRSFEIFLREKTDAAASAFFQNIGRCHYFSILASLYS